MNNEIKEVLEKFDREVKKAELIRKPYSSEDKKYKMVGIYLEEEHCNIFKNTLDYITNLQQENEKLNEELGDANYTITQLHKVIDRHYKQRIDKAIEYIERSSKEDLLTLCKDKLLVADEDGHIDNLDILLNILKGEDK